MSGDGGYAAARTGAAFIALRRGVLEATGPKRLDFLQGMLTNDVVRLGPGQGCRTAVLDVKGHVQALLRALCTPTALLLETTRERLAPVEAVLNRHKVAAPVRFRARDEGVLALLGPGAADVLGAAGGTAPGPEPESHLETSLAGVGVRVARAGDLPAHGLVLHVPPAADEAVAAALRAAGAAPLEPAALDALRVEEGRAFYGPDVGEDNLLHETGQAAEYASFSKGCYIGQEVMARLDARGGHVNKALRALRLEAPTRPGAVLRAEGKEVGRVTTAAVSPAFGAIALAYVHRSHFEPGTRLEVEGVKAEVVALPFVGR